MSPASRECRWLLWLACTGACLLGPLQAATGAMFYKLEVSRNGDRYRVSADVHVDATPAQVYAALTDFTHLPQLDASIRQSRRLRQLDAHTQLVYMETRGCVAIFCRTIRQLQQFTELSRWDIVAVTLPAGSNVKQGSSSWHLRPEGGGTRLYWESSIEPDFWIPPLIGANIMVDELREQGLEFIRGIERRYTLPPPGVPKCCPEAAAGPRVRRRL